MNPEEQGPLVFTPPKMAASPTPTVYSNNASPGTPPPPTQSTAVSLQSAPAMQGIAGSSGPRLSAVEISAAEEAKNKLERMVKLEAMVEKRKNCFTYIKKIHQGDHFWLNCVLLRQKADLAIYATELPRQRVLQLFYLGISLARLIQSTAGGQLVRSILQLMEEWEYYFAGSATQSVKAMMGKNVDHPYPTTAYHADGAGGDAEQVVARIYKFSNDVIFEHLLTPHVPFALDYFEVMYSLSDTVCLIYNKFMDEECYSNPAIFEALVKVDGKIKHHMLNVTAKEFTDMSVNIVKAELGQIR